MAQQRIALLMMVAAAAIGVLVIRLIVVQVFEHEIHMSQAESTRERRVLVPPKRADITDRFGVPLAVDEPAWDLHVNFWLFTEPANVLRRIEARGGVPTFTPQEERFFVEYLQQLAAYRADTSVPKPRRFTRTWIGRNSVPAIGDDAEHAQAIRQQHAVDLLQLAELLRRPVEDVMAARELYVREENATLAQLAILLECDVRPFLDAFDRVKRMVDRTLRADTERFTERYAQIVQLGANAGYWADRAREERRAVARDEMRPEERRYAGGNPLVLVEDLPRVSVETVLELDGVFFGLTTEARSTRYYPQGSAAAHILGYTRPIDRVGFESPTRNAWDAELAEIREEQGEAAAVAWRKENPPPAFDTAESPHYQRMLRRALRDLTADDPDWIARHIGSEELFADRFKFVIDRIQVGVTGMEKQIDRLPYTQGAFGASIVQSDVSARAQIEIPGARIEPRAAGEVRLTLDLAIQRVAERELQQVWDTWGCAGAAVCMDVVTGEIIAIASSPTFDVNRLMSDRPEDIAYFRYLLNGDEPHENPLFNRAVQGAVQPGSVFKLLTSIAIVEEGIVTGPNYIGHANSDGSWDRWEAVSSRKAFTSTHAYNGPIGLHTAIVDSDNIYFYEEAYRLGYAKLVEWARRFGFGESTGVAGSDPSGWREGRDGRPINVFVPGEPENGMWSAASMAIGMDRLRTTPLQVARFMSAIATRGYLPTPRLFRNTPATEPEYVAVSDATWDILHRSLVDVPRSGTARSISDLRALDVAGKTGTADFLDAERGEVSHAWFASYGPHTNPRYAVVAYVERTVGSGASRAGPVVAGIYKALQASEHWGGAWDE